MLGGAVLLRIVGEPKAEGPFVMGGVPMACPVPIDVDGSRPLLGREGLCEETTVLVVDIESTVSCPVV